MSKKTGNNDPCPCGSGKKYKHCHRDSEENLSPPPHNEGLIIKDYTGKEVENWSIGGPGVEVDGLVFSQGDINPIVKQPDNYRFVLDVDIPILIPLPDSVTEKYEFEYNSQPFFFYHKTKKRGEESYSTIDTSHLPFFSTIQIHGIASKELLSMESPKFFSYDLILFVLQMINEFLGDSKLEIGGNPLLSYYVIYLDINDKKFEHPLVKSTYPYSGTVSIKAPRNQEAVNTEEFKRFLSESIRIQGFSAQNIVPRVKDETFENSVFISAHDFAYYANQHPKAMGMLQEEELRDLYLVVLKCVFGSAEGEVYNYDGKLDFKIINAENKYEFIIGEFKIWNDQSSITEAFHQVARKHCSGQELQLYIMMISTNKDTQKLNTKLIDSIKSEKEYVKCESDNISPKGSKQLFSKHIIKTKDQEIPLVLGTLNLYHSKE